MSLTGAGASWVGSWVVVAVAVAVAAVEPWCRALAPPCSHSHLLLVVVHVLLLPLHRRFLVASRWLRRASCRLRSPAAGVTRRPTSLRGAVTVVSAAGPVSIYDGGVRDGMERGQRRLCRGVVHRKDRVDGGPDSRPDQHEPMSERDRPADPPMNTVLLPTFSEAKAVGWGGVG